MQGRKGFVSSGGIVASGPGVWPWGANRAAGTEREETMVYLTKRQREILEFLREFQARNGYAPSLEEIAAATRINLRYLRALEEDDFAEFPSDFFARSVIRSFARAVGLDEKEALARLLYHDLHAAGRRELAEVGLQLRIGIAVVDHDDRVRGAAPCREHALDAALQRREAPVDRDDDVDFGHQLRPDNRCRTAANG